MASTDQDFTIYAGNDVDLMFTLYESDGATPLDLTGLTVEWGLGSIFGGDRVLLKDNKTVGGIAVPSPTTGVINITLAHADTEILGGQPYHQEVVIIDTHGNTTTVATGTVTILGSLF